LVRPSFSADILEEYAAGLARPKFAFPPDEIEAALAMFHSQGELFALTFRRPRIPIRATPSSCNARRPPRRIT
jgi:hypothetical protein